jgi:hypothetical protein
MSLAPEVEDLGALDREPPASVNGAGFEAGGTTSGSRSNGTGASTIQLAYSTGWSQVYLHYQKPDGGVLPSHGSIVQAAVLQARSLAFA